jgi:hypothetical protein
MLADFVRHGSHFNIAVRSTTSTLINDAETDVGDHRRRLSGGAA